MMIYTGNNISGNIYFLYQSWYAATDSDVHILGYEEEFSFAT